MASHSCTNRAGTQPEQESLLVGMLAEIVARENDDATVDEGTEYCHAVRELAPETHSTRGFRNRPARDGHHVVGGHSDVQLHNKAIIETQKAIFRAAKEIKHTSSNSNKCCHLPDDIRELKRIFLKKLCGAICNACLS